MRFTQKLQKLFDPRLLRSMKQHTGRVFLTRRLVFRITPEKIIASIDREKFEAIRDRHAVDDPGKSWPKYLDLQQWIKVNLRRVRQLELDYGRRRSILDIGSGAGYFLYICKWLGHDATGLDIDEVPMYPEMTRMLGLKRIVWRIEAFKPLPASVGRYDLITAFMICFNNHNRPDVWTKAEWAFFLDDISRHLNPGGKLWLELNPEPGHVFYTPELKNYFESRGAEIEEHRVLFNSMLPAQL